MNFLNFNTRKLLWLLFAIVFPFLSINVEQKRWNDSWLNSPFQLIASSAQQAFEFFGQDVKATTALYINLIGIKKDNEQLKAQNQELQSRLEASFEQQKENERLRGLLEFQSKSPMKLTAAQVIGKDLILDHSTLTINKGTSHGLKAGQAVIALGGALGYIFKPGPKTAHVMLVTDRYSVVDGIIQRTRARGIVEGNSNSSCLMKYVDRTEDVQPGDLIVTGGLDNLFPKGFPIARVDSVERKTFSISLKVNLKPVVDPDKVEEVFVVFDTHEKTKE